MNEDEIKLNEILYRNFFDSSKKNVPSKFTYKDISKIVSERFIGNDRLNIKIFFYSEGKECNNKPYTMRERTLQEFTLLNDLLNKCRANQPSVFNEDLNDAQDLVQLQEETLKDKIHPLVAEQSDTIVEEENSFFN